MKFLIFKKVIVKLISHQFLLKVFLSTFQSPIYHKFISSAQKLTKDLVKWKRTSNKRQWMKNTFVFFKTSNNQVEKISWQAVAHPNINQSIKKKCQQNLLKHLRDFYLMNKNISLKSTKESSVEMGSGGVNKSNLQYVQSQSTGGDERKKLEKAFLLFLLISS